MQSLFDMSSVYNPVHRVSVPVPVNLVGHWSAQEEKIIRKYNHKLTTSEDIRQGVCNITRNGTTTVPSSRFWHNHGTYVFSFPSFSGDFSRRAYEGFAWCAQACHNIFTRGFDDPDMTLTLDYLLSLPQEERVLSFDVETTSLLPSEGYFSCASFCLMNQPLCHVVFGHEETKKAISVLHDAGFSFLVCNAPFEVKWCKYHCKRDIEIFDDVQVLSAHLNEEGHKGLEFISAWVGMAGYDHLMQDHLVPLSPRDGSAAGQRRHFEAPRDLLLSYNAMDAVVTAMAYEKMYSVMQGELQRAGVNNCPSHKILLDSQITLASMELNGMYINPHEMLTSRAYLLHTVREAINTITAECAKKGNPDIDLSNLGNPKNRAKALQAAGVRCNGASKGELLKYKGNKAVDAMLAWSSAQSLLSGIMTYAEEACAHGGLLRTSFSVTSLVTGQLTSRNPPMLNIAKSPIRKMFVSRFGKDGVLLSLDYSQLHLRIMANVAKCAGYIDAFLNDRDLHCLTGALVVIGIPEDEFLGRLADGDKNCEDARQIGKRVNFSVITEVTGHGLSDLLNTSVKQADLILGRYYEVYPEVKEIHDKQHEFACKHGYVVSPTGRIRHLREARSQIPALKARAGRQATDYLVSNPGRTTTLIAMNAMHNKLTRYGMRSVIVNQLHDAIIHDVHLSELNTIIEWAKECYIDEPQRMLPEVFNPVKLVLDGHYGPHWYYKDKEAVKVDVR